MATSNRQLFLIPLLAWTLSAACYVGHIFNAAVRPLDPVTRERVMVNEAILFIVASVCVILCLIAALQARGTTRVISGIALLLSLWILKSNL